MSHSLPAIAALLLNAAWAQGCGGSSLPPVASSEESDAASEPSAPREQPSPRPGKTTLELTFEVARADSKGTVVIFIDGSFLVIDETWEPSAVDASMRWGTRRSRMLFDSDNELLIAVDLERNAFSRITAERISEENSLRGDNAPLGGPGGSSVLAFEPPRPTKTPKRPHPQGCEAFSRDLPRGLVEETCFKPWERFGLPAPDLGPLFCFIDMLGVLDRPPPEIGIALSIANAMFQDKGALVSLYEFGLDPFEEEDDKDLQPWDVVVELRAAEWKAPDPGAFDIPKNAEEKTALVPWNRGLLF